MCSTQALSLIPGRPTLATLWNGLESVDAVILSMEEIGENLYSFTDSPLTEDKFSDDYDQYLGTSTALIIDNGKETVGA